MHLKKFPVFEEFIKKHNNIKAFAFDMDGTLLNTEHLHAQAHLSLINTHSAEQNLYNFEKMLHDFMGIDDLTVYKQLKNEKLIPDQQSFDDFQKLKNHEISKILNNSKLDNYCSPILLDFIKKAKVHGTKIFLVTSSERALCELLLKLFEIYDLFDFITTRNDVEKCKPHPQPYLQTFKSNEVNPQDSIVFEDSDAGYTSGKSSGAFTYKVSWYEN